MTNDDPLQLLAECLAEPASVRLMRDTATRFVTDAGGDPRTVEDAKLAVSEAASNVVRHAYPDCRPGLFQLLGEVDDGTVLLVIQDRGRGLAAESGHSGLGMGLKIIADSASQSRFSERDGGGTAIYARFELAGVEH